MIRKVTVYKGIGQNKKMAKKAKGGESISVTTIDKLAEIVTENAYSLSIFKNGERSNKHFLSADYIGIDIDNNLSLREAKKRIRGLNLEAIITTTVSHLKRNKSGNTSERFRLIFTLEKQINSVPELMEMYELLYNHFPESDRGCFKGSQFFFQSNKGDPESEVISGEKLSTTKLYPDGGGVCSLLKNEDIYFVETKGTVFQNKYVKDFVDNAKAGLEGEFNDKLFKCCSRLAEAGFTKEEIEKIVEDVAPSPLDSTDLRTIKSAMKAKDSSSGEPKEWAAFKKNQVDSLNEHAFQIGLSCDYDGRFFQNDVEFKKDIIIDAFYIEFRKRNQSISKDLIKSYLNLFEDRKKREYVENIKEIIKFKERNNLLLDFTASITETDSDLTFRVLYHFIWCVKRKLFGLPVKNHIMPVITGKTGGGKSTAFNKLIGPLATLSFESDLSIVNDDRNNFMFNERRIVFFDEMAKSDQANISRLKSIITADTVSYRLLGHNSMVKVTNNASFLGASNEKVVDLINDPTSMRRYYEIVSLDQLNWELINSISYNDLWSGVNEERESLLEGEWLDKLREHQGLIRRRDSVEEWCEECEIIPMDDDNRSFTTTNELYDQYREWCDSSGVKYLFQKNKFSRNLKGLLGATSSEVRKLNNKSFRGYLIRSTDDSISDDY